MGAHRRDLCPYCGRTITGSGNYVRHVAAHRRRGDEPVIPWWRRRGVAA